MAGGNNDDPAWILLIMIVIFWAIGALIWHFYNAPMLEALRYFKLVEMAPFALFDAQAASCAKWLYHAQVGAQALPSDAAIAGAIGCFGGANLSALPVQERGNFLNVTPSSIGFVSQYIGSYLKWVVFAVCAYVAYYAIFRSHRNKFKTRHNLESFIKAQSAIWKVIAPIVSFNPAKHSARVLGQEVPSKLPLFAEPLAPEEWIAFHRIPVVKGVPSREAVHQALMLQLGPRWSGSFDDLPFYMQALMAAFALKGVQKRDESDDLLGRISECWSQQKGLVYPPALVSEIKKLLKDPAIGGEALGVAKNFAYRTTAVLGILKWARFMGGVLASAQFLWLRGVDRELWYALNNLGRRSFHSEGAGALGHYMAEDLAKKALLVPRFETAIAAINKYLSDNQVTIPPNAEGKRA